MMGLLGCIFFFFVVSVVGILVKCFLDGLKFIFNFVGVRIVGRVGRFIRIVFF